MTTTIHDGSPSKKYAQHAFCVRRSCFVVRSRSKVVRVAQLSSQLPSKQNGYACLVNANTHLNTIACGHCHSKPSRVLQLLMTVLKALTVVVVVAGVVGD